MQKDNKIDVQGDNNLTMQDVKLILDMANGRQLSIPKYLTIPPDPPKAFTGREEELKGIYRRLHKEETLLLLSGYGGFGKTALAQRYCQLHRDDYQCILWFRCNSSIEEGLIYSTEIEKKLLLAFDEKETLARRFERVREKLADLPGKHLMVIDNANEVESLQRVHLHLPNWHVLLTSRAQLYGTDIPHLRIDVLDAPLAAELFCKYFPSAANNPDLLHELLDTIGCHTLTVELLAKNLRELNRYEDYPLARLLEQLQQKGLLQFSDAQKVFTHYTHQEELIPSLLSAMFDLSQLNPYEQYTLELLSVLPPAGILHAHTELLLRYPTPTLPKPAWWQVWKRLPQTNTPPPLSDTLQKLVRTGWLDYDDNTRTYTVHQIIREVVRAKHPPTYARCRSLVDTLKALLGDKNIKLGDKLPYLPYAQSLAQRLPDAELAGLCFSACERHREVGNLQLGMWFAEEAQKRYLLAGDKHNAAKLYQKIGDIYKAYGQFDKMLASFERYNGLIQKLLNDNPDSEGLKNDLAISYSKLGDLWQNKGDFTQALDFFKKYNQHCKELYEANQQNENHKFQLAVSYERLGTLWQDKGDFNQALDFFEKRAHLGEALYRANPHNENLKNGLAVSYFKLGDLWQKKGDFEKALDFFEKYNQLREALYRANPHNENLKNGLAISYEKLGTLWQDKGDFNQALDFFEKHNQLTKELYRANPHNENLKNGLAISYNRLGLLWLAQNDMEKALPYLQQDVQLTEELALANPSNFNLQNNRCHSWRDMGDVLVALNQKEEALAFYQKAEAGWQALWEQTPLPSIQEDLEELRKEISDLDAH